MSWIEETPAHEAQGPLADVYRRISPGGRIANILSVQSLHPAGLRDHYALYRTLIGMGPDTPQRLSLPALCV